MTQALLNINWLAVVIATVAYFGLGGFWYWRPIFGKHYDDALGFERPDNWKWTSIYFTVPFLSCLLASIGVSVLTNAINPTSSSDTIIFGLVIGVCFAIAVALVNAVTPTMKKPIKYGLITGVYHTTGMTITALIIYGMTK